MFLSLRDYRENYRLTRRECTERHSETHFFFSAEEFASGLLRTSIKLFWVLTRTILGVCYQLALPLDRPRNRKSYWNHQKTEFVLHNLVTFSNFLSLSSKYSSRRLWAWKSHEKFSTFVCFSSSGRADGEAHWHFSCRCFHHYWVFCFFWAQKNSCFILIFHVFHFIFLLLSHTDLFAPIRTLEMLTQIPNDQLIC